MTMREKMIDAATRAFHESYKVDAGVTDEEITLLCGEPSDYTQWTPFVTEAVDAALEALAEPSEGMVEAMTDRVSEGGMDDLEWLTSDDAERLARAMIQAAREGK